MGDGTSIERLVPSVQAYYSASPIQLSISEHHALLLQSDGVLWSWGSNDYGELGDGSTTSRSYPGKVNLSVLKDKANVSQISAGYSHSLMLTDDGQLFAWGNQYADLGSSPSITNPIAVDMSAFNGSMITHINAGYTRSVALTSAGTVYQWGIINDVKQIWYPTVVSGVLHDKYVTQVSLGSLLELSTQLFHMGQHE